MEETPPLLQAGSKPHLEKLTLGVTRILELYTYIGVMSWMALLVPAFSIWVQAALGPSPLSPVYLLVYQLLGIPPISRPIRVHRVMGHSSAKSKALSDRMSFRQWPNSKCSLSS
ncbi:tubulin polyglutamylase complex subunit 2 isoform c [Cricetulus griseus]|uniref:Tubulin polyglutamylase complex subunit 2 isoform c n=1 Tax=Cricetulus griseus TaxID=10029 RepID=A0A061IFR4_CRIGR|nr:tubulin polyglutamylase complex subunit 2 isoform c [Cricetulus griseus]